LTFFGIVLAPVVRRFFHKFHLEVAEKKSQLPDPKKQP
jgi:hypothetical protein